MMEDYRDDTVLLREEAPPSVPGFRRWLVPALTAATVLILVIALGSSNSRMSTRLGSAEQSVAELSLAIRTLNSSLLRAEGTAAELRSSVENVKDQLTSVAEALKQLSDVDALSRTVASLRCSLDRVINNGSAAAGCCPLGWDVFGSSCYFFSESVLSWNESRAWCEGRGSHLVILSSDGEWDFVTRHTIPEFFWIGLTDGRTGQWEWVNRTPYTMQRRRWVPGQPDSWTGHGLGGNEDCAHVHASGRLNDVHCSSLMRYVCQKRSHKA